MNDNASSLSRENRLALIILAVAQSLLLLLLHKAFEHDLWPADSSRWIYALYALVIGVPLFLYFGAVEWRDRANALVAAALAVILFWVGWHAGWLDSVWGSGHHQRFELVPLLVVSAGAALFILGFYFRTHREFGGLDYHGLLDHSWRNALTFGFLGLFIGVFWLLLLLWAQLFRVIEIDFFADLFGEAEFIYPVTGLVGGWGLGLIRGRERMIATVRNLCETLIRALLPLVAFILVIFLVALPFTGLAPLWETGFASALLLWLAAVLLFFFNAVIADDAGHFIGFSWLRRFVLLALVLLPVNAILAAWSMGLRIDQYGLTVERLWAVLIETFIAAFSIGYAAIILRHRGLAVGAIRRWNTIVGAALAVTLILVNLPVLDFHRLSTNSQVNRLLEGDVRPADFDARYLRFQLGAYGINALEELRTSEFADEHPVLKTRIEDALAAENRWSPQPAAQRDDIDWVRERFQVLPGTEVSDEFLRELAENAGPSFGCFQQTVSHCVLGDTERNGRRYRLLASTRPYGNASRVWQWQGEQWQKIGCMRRFGCGKSLDTIALDEPFVAVRGEFILFRNGDCLYQVQPDADAVRHE